MSLLDRAAADNARLLQSTVLGFARAVTVTDPSGNTAELNALCNDVSQTVDADTGVLVSGQVVTVTLPLVAVSAAGLSGEPGNVSDAASKPWLMSFVNGQGQSQTYKVTEAIPDRTLGSVTCRLSVFRT